VLRSCIIKKSAVFAEFNYHLFIPQAARLLNISLCSS